MEIENLEIVSFQVSQNIPPSPPSKKKSTQSPTLDHWCGSGHRKSPAWSKPFFDRPNILIVLSVMKITSKNTTETVIIMIKNFRENGLNCKKLRFYLQEKNIRWSSSWKYCFQYWVSNANVRPYFLRLYCWSVVRHYLPGKLPVYYVY